MKVSRGVLNTWLFQNPEFQDFRGECFEIQSFNSCCFCCEPTVLSIFWATRWSFTPVLGEMHQMLFPYRLSQQKKVPKPCHYSTETWLLLASSIGIHLLPNHSSFPSHQHFQHWWELHSRSTELANWRCYKQSTKALSPYAGTHIHFILLCRSQTEVNHI